MEYTESGHPRTVTPYYSGGAGGRHTGRLLPSVLIFLTLTLVPLSFSHGQRNSDPGIIGGTSYYLGDMNHSGHFNSPAPAAGLIYRYNFNSRNSIRFTGIYAMVKGDPADFDEPFRNSGNEAFTANMVDIGMTTEFNFMPYETTKIRKDRYTPYVSGGIGYSLLIGGTSTPSLSFGGGFKYNLTMRLSAGAEWTFRKTFSDEIDNVQNIGYENNVFFHNKDWYSIVGVFVTYKIFDWGLDCPAYEQ